MENPELQEKWQEIIAAYRGSGLSAVEWCEVTGCTIGRLKYWITKFNKAKQQPLEVTKWTQVELVDSRRPQSTAISIHGGAARIDRPLDSTTLLLADVLKVAATSC